MKKRPRLTRGKIEAILFALESLGQHGQGLQVPYSARERQLIEAARQWAQVQAAKMRARSRRRAPGLFDEEVTSHETA